jgi:hypothetical protein
MRIGIGNRSPMAFCPPQIPHDLTLDLRIIIIIIIIIIIANLTRLRAVFSCQLVF